jgi:hypothetical protein
MSLLDTLLALGTETVVKKLSPVSPVSPAVSGGPPEVLAPPAAITAAVPSLAACGQPYCAGCYEVEPGRHIHPPKTSQEWLNWLARWNRPKGEGVQ